MDRDALYLAGLLDRLAPHIKQAELERLLGWSPRFLTRAKNGHIKATDHVIAVLDLLAARPAQQVELLRRVGCKG